MTFLRRSVAPFAGASSGPARGLLRSRSRLGAALAGSAVHLSVSRCARISPWVDVDVWPGTETTVIVADGASIGDHVRLSLRGGVLRIGRRTEVRRLGTYNVGGDLSIGDGVVMSNGVCVHCASSVEIGDLTIIGEYTTITDSSHVRTPPGVPIHHEVTTSSVRIGTNIWVGAHAVIGAGVTVGDQAFVGAGAVVTRDVPAGWLAAGVPARPVRSL